MRSPRMKSSWPLVGWIKARLRPDTTSRRGGAVAKIPGRIEPVLVGIVGEHDPLAADAIDDFAGHTFAQRRASPAAAEAAVLLHEVVADVRRAVHHDRPLTRTVIEAFVESLETQRIPVLADVGVFGQ